MNVQAFENTKVFSLKNIAKWTTKESGVSIPALQRGLVWSPKQTEFLWDSILRTFPIGGFVLSQNSDGSFYLMDGQQRYNAIRLGFVEPNENENIILWIDLKPNEKKSTRLFFIKATTKIHPWGFKNNDECDVLSASERQLALENFGHKGGNIFKTPIGLQETFPVKSIFPIPLSYILNSSLNSVEEYIKEILKKIETLPETWKTYFKWNGKENTDEITEILTKYYNLIKKLLVSNPYIVPCSILSQESISKETDITAEMDQTNLEILFTRLNKGGTAITQEDLYYSAIKAYWENIKETLDKLAEDKMPPQYLAMLFFRLALTIKDESSTKFVGNLSIKQIRQLAGDEQTKSFIETFIQNDANRIIDKVYDALSEIPRYLIMKIITRKRDIFLLLMFFAYKDLNLKSLNATKLAMYLYWFSTDPTTTVNELYKCLNDVSEKTISEQKFHEIKQVLSTLVLQGRIINVYEPCEIKLDVSSLKRPEIETAIDFFWNIISDYKHNSFLIFAEKDFINSYFPEYNPANIKGWDKTNCPWDYDHIIPKSWSEYQLKSNPYKSIVDYWLWRLGNFAAIPFEENRSKNNNVNYQFYLKDDNADKLFFDNKITNVTSKFIADENEARLFANITYNRTIRIYESCYNYMKIWLPVLSPEAKRRKDLFKSIQCELKDFRFFYVFGNRECSITSENDWNQKCLSLAMPINNDFMISLTWNIGQYREPTFEIGFRKYFSQTHLNNEISEKLKTKSLLREALFMGDWWYSYGLYPEKDNDKQKCKDLLKNLYEAVIK